MTPKLQLERRRMPDDNELMLLTEYVGGFMSDAEVERFEQRLVDDMDFFDRMEPFLDAWYAPGILPTEVEIAKRLEIALPVRAVRVAPPVVRYRRYVIFAAAAGLAIMMIPVGGRQPDRAGTQFSHRAWTPRVPTQVAASKPSKTPTTRHGAPTGTEIATRTPFVVGPTETAAERALLESVVGAMPSAHATPSAAVATTVVLPTPVVADELSAMVIPLDSTSQNGGERGRDLVNPAKPNGADKIVKQGWWQRLKGWVFHIPPKELMTMGKVP